MANPTQGPDDHRPDSTEGAEPDGLGTPDLVAGNMESDIAAEPPRQGADRLEPEDPAAPERQARDGARAEATASGLRQPGGEERGDEEPSLGARRAEEAGGADPAAPARQAGGEDELSPGRDDPREDEGWSQPESSAQKDG